MMTATKSRLVFVHDHRFLRGRDDALYTVGSFPRVVWERYLKAFDEVVVVARDGGLLPDNADLARSDLPGVRFELIPDFTLSQRLLGLNGTASVTLEREIARADAVLVRLPSDLGNLGAAVARRLNVPWAAEVVGCALDGYGHQGSLISKAYAPLATHRLKRVARSAEQALYVTREFLQRRYPSPGDTVGVSCVEIVAADVASLARREDRLASLRAGRAPIFGTVASLRIMSKGIQDVLPTLARLRAEGVQVQYRVLGAGDQEPWLRRAAECGVSDLVHFDGTRPSGEGVREWLDEIDVHLQPSYQEGLPRATIEAMSRGCACLGSTAGGIPEIIPADRTHAPGDRARLAALIGHYAVTPDSVAAASAVDRRTSAEYLPEVLDPVRASFFRRLAQRAGRSDAEAA